MEEETSRPFYTPEEFRKILRCSRAVCYEALRRHKIRSFRLGRKYFISASEVNRLSQQTRDENDNKPRDDPDLW